MAPDQRPPETLPDPWLFDTEALIRELDRCRELILAIPATTQEAHFASNVAINANWNLREHIRSLLAMHREGQRSWQRRAAKALSDVPKPNPGRQGWRTDSQCTPRRLTAGCTSTDRLMVAAFFRARGRCRVVPPARFL